MLNELNIDNENEILKNSDKKSEEKNSRKKDKYVFPTILSDYNMY